MSGRPIARSPKSAGRGRRRGGGGRGWGGMSRGDARVGEAVADPNGGSRSLRGGGSFRCYRIVSISIAIWRKQRVPESPVLRFMERITNCRRLFGKKRGCNTLVFHASIQV
jgi:hypothetical protein